MGKPEPVAPVKLLVAILHRDSPALQEALPALRDRWGEIDFEGEDHPFDVTDYYEDEMGPGLKRRLVSFRELVPPESLVAAKLACNEIEDRLSDELGRRANLDIGYLDHSKLVLASVKFAGQKIHLANGVYADLVGRFGRGRYQPFDWTFPDFRDGRYDAELGCIRKAYLEQLRSGRHPMESSAPRRNP